MWRNFVSRRVKGLSWPLKCPAVAAVPPAWSVSERVTPSGPAPSDSWRPPDLPLSSMSLERGVLPLPRVGGVPSSMAECPQPTSTFSVGPAVEGCALQGSALGLLSTCPQVADLEWKPVRQGRVQPRSHRTFRCLRLRLWLGGPAHLRRLPSTVRCGLTVSIAAGLAFGLGDGGRRSQSSLAPEGFWYCGA